MSIEQMIIMGMAPLAMFGAVRAFMRIDKTIEAIREHAGNVATICEKAGLEVLQTFFHAISIGDKAGAIRSAAAIVNQLAPDKFWDTLSTFFYKQLDYRLEHRESDMILISRKVDAARVKQAATLRMQLRVDSDQHARRTDESVLPAPASLPTEEPKEPTPIATAS